MYKVGKIMGKEIFIHTLVIIFTQFMQSFSQTVGSFSQDCAQAFMFLLSGFLRLFPLWATPDYDDYEFNYSYYS